MQDNKISLSMKQTEQPQQQQRTRNQNGDARILAPSSVHLAGIGIVRMFGSRQSPSRRCLNCPLKICSASSSRTAKNVSATSSGTLNGKTVPEESKFAFGRNTKEHPPCGFQIDRKGDVVVFQSLGVFKRFCKKTGCLCSSRFLFADGIHAGKPSMQSAAE